MRAGERRRRRKRAAGSSHSSLLLRQLAISTNLAYVGGLGSNREAAEDSPSNC